MDLLIESLDEAYEAITAKNNKLLAKKNMKEPSIL